MFRGLMRRGLAAPFALVAGFGALLALGTVAAGLHGRLTATGVLICSAVIVGAMSFVAEPAAAVPLGVIGWLTAVGFSRPPYANLRPTGPHAVHAAVAIGVSALLAAGAGLLFRWSARRFTLVVVGIDSGRAAGGEAYGSGRADPLPAARAAQVADGFPGEVAAGTGDGARTRPRRGVARLAGAIDARRQLYGMLLTAAGLPLLTVILAAGRPWPRLADDLLIYLVAVVVIAVIGGFWPAVVAAVAACILLNWYFTPPLHTFTIEEPQNLLALLLFVTVAVAVSSVVHLAARRAVLAARSREEAASLLSLAQTVLGGADTPSAVLDHLTATLGGAAELQENVAGRWVPIAVSGSAPSGAVSSRIDVRANLALLVAGQSGQVTPGLLAGFAAQAAAALDRERLRTQAAQAEALAEGNRMRTALLAAVSHDLRTPLASIKASVSSLRQTDVQWTVADETALLATIEQNADRLDALIGNLLDMSRLHTGSLEPFLRSITIDEVAPVALRGLDSSMKLEMDVPDGLPLVRADPGLLERVLANLFSNALRHSPPPPAPPPLLRVFRLGDTVVLDVVDHGQGVPDALKPRIFEPFQRLDERSAGVGLGLAVAKGFAEAMGGSIAATDTPGGGLTVRVTLPIAHVQTRPVLGADQ
jgi:two-component system, OmpR family, sensor histidine kinase KdpD